ncbi:MAG TPA: hypothetical protein VG733_13265, partial [Chthoniobacteraceae bacterium]|nr:hypothetical protein [Chthoniobacteraceae bacterium]
ELRAEVYADAAGGVTLPSSRRVSLLIEQCVARKSLAWRGRLRAIAPTGRCLTHDVVQDDFLRGLKKTYE